MIVKFETLKSYGFTFAEGNQMESRGLSTLDCLST